MTDEVIATQEVVETPVTGADTTAVKTEAATSVDGVSALLNDGDVPDTKPTATWPTDWREQLAGSDEAFLRQLKRYSSPNTFAKGFLERESLIRSGKVKRDMPDGADEKAMAEWRKEQGVPDNPNAYKVPEIEGHQWTDADKPVLGQFFEYAHKSGLPQSAADVAVSWYANAQREAVAAQIEADRAASAEAMNALAGEWGAELKANKTLAVRYLGTVPELGISVAEFRGPDGRRLGDIPEFVRWAADKGREFYGDAAFIGSNGSSTIGDEKAALEQLMKTNFEEYERSGGPAKMRKIIDTELSRGKR